MRIPAKFSVLVTALVMALIVTACGGSASPSTNGGGSDPAAVAKAFLTAAYSGGDLNSYLCTSNAAAAKSIADGMNTMKTSLTASGAKISTDKLTFDAGTVSGDTAQVKVGGSLTTTINGASQDTPYSGVTIPLKKENGAWKVCG